MRRAFTFKCRSVYNASARKGALVLKHHTDNGDSIASTYQGLALSSSPANKVRAAFLLFGPRRTGGAIEYAVKALVILLLHLRWSIIIIIIMIDDDFDDR